MPKTQTNLFGEEDIDTLHTLNKEKREGASNIKEIEVIKSKKGLSLLRNAQFIYELALAKKEGIEFQRHRKRKSHNQYFTPEFAVEKAISLIVEAKVTNVIDPAVGQGVFLRVVAKKWLKAELFGVDIDQHVIFELTKLNLSNSYFACTDSLLQQTWQLPKIKKILSRGGFDLVVGNPPFSSWFNRIKLKDILSNYELGTNNGNIKRSQAIEILFLEIFIKLAKKGGFVVIILPDGVLSNPQYQYIREFILKSTKVLHIINLPRNVFEETSAKTSILILKKQEMRNMNYFVILHDLEKTGRINNAIKVSGKDLIKRMDYCFYHNLQKSPLQGLINKGLVLKPLKDFMIYCKTGKTLYGKEREFSDKGLRFLHATNITDIGVDYKKDERFIGPLSKMDFPNANAKVGDIVFVRVGVGCAGRVAVINTNNEEGIATDYIHILRVKNINPYLLVIYLKTKYGKWSINLLRHGVGTVSINKTDLLSIPIPIVSERIQTEIEKQYRNILAEYSMGGVDIMIKANLVSLIHYLEEQLQGLSLGREKKKRAACYVEL